ncbi:asparagine synthase-related protein [Paenibacillus thailandensis]|uniref:asparagine synthase (glutamine-hydrolyzing) n=1 Tax=Paenibacillus thailandensis TaxID=393250 RepID=A0ABW5R3N9_9BACL
MESIESIGTELAEFSNELCRYPGDGFSIWQQEAAAMMCQNQWITPESVNERLPLHDPNAGLVIAADAILDNRKELFRHLGLYLQQNEISDAELILRAYEKWGVEAAKHLIGDFAFVIWDDRNKLLYGARDLLGSRTLYYCCDRRGFIFSSVIHPIFALSSVHRSINEERLSEFLAIPSVLDAVDIRSTLYKDIYQLPPAHSFTYSNGNLNIQRYGSLVPEGSITYRNDDDYVEAFQELFRESIRSRCRTFKKVGVTLSGGLDSGSVAGFAANMLEKEGKTLNAYSHVPAHGFEDWTPDTAFADERPYIQSVVDYVQNITPNYLELPGINPYTEIEDLLGMLETPYKNFENSYWIKSIYQQAAADDVGILLTGARGNFSISWGSAIELYAVYLKRLKWVHLFKEVSKFGEARRVGRKRVVQAIRKQAFPERMKTPFVPHVDSLISPDFAAKTAVFEKLAAHDVGLRPSTATVLTERQDYFSNLAIFNLQGTLAAKNSYRFKVWERDPTSDPRLVRFCLSIPFDQYVRNGYGRSLIRRATEHILPDKVRLNQSSRGIQGIDWAYRVASVWPDIIKEVRELCRDERFRSYVNADQVQRAVEKTGFALTSEQASDPNSIFIMRSLIAGRFIRGLG